MILSPGKCAVQSVPSGIPSNSPINHLDDFLLLTKLLLALSTCCQRKMNENRKADPKSSNEMLPPMGNLNLFRHCKVISKLYKFPFPPSQPCCHLTSPQPQISLLISSMTHLPRNLGCGIWPACTNAAGQVGNSQDYTQQLITLLS